MQIGNEILCNKILVMTQRGGNENGSIVFLHLVIHSSPSDPRNPISLNFSSSFILSPCQERYKYLQASHLSTIEIIADKLP